MDLNRMFGGNPRRWVASHGRPARCVVYHGMPSYESADQRIKLMTAVVMQGALSHGWMVSPLDYEKVSAETPEGLVRGRWRPVLTWFVGGKENLWMGGGSQHELHFRYAMTQPWKGAAARARERLLDNLTEHQMLEYALFRKFTVKGGMTGNLYRVDIDNGFELINNQNGEVLVSYCLHPEHWMPGEDVALLHKLALEDPDTENATVARAQSYPKHALMRSLLTVLNRPEEAVKYPLPRRVTRAERYIAHMERELI